MYFPCFEMDMLSIEEKMEMVLIYGEARTNVTRAIHLYAEQRKR